VFVEILIEYTRPPICTNIVQINDEANQIHLKVRCAPRENSLNEFVNFMLKEIAFRGKTLHSVLLKLGTKCHV
jgi:hypothetical protein